MVGYAFHYKLKMLEEEKKKPSWLELFLATKFFSACAEHKGIKKKMERNIYCVDCNESMCSFCVSSPSCSHRFHRLLQIRRYIYQNVIKIRDMQNLIDCSEVQPYIVNGAKVVLLNPRMQSKPSKSAVSGTFCKSCRRTVAERNGYCSIACKVLEKVAQPPELDAGFVSDGGCSPAKLIDFELSPEEECTFSIGSLQQSDWGMEDRSRWIEDPIPSPKPRVVRRKGTPRRSPIS